MKRIGAVLSIVGRALDGLDIAFCVYDAQLRLLTFNSTFLTFFPEHRTKIHHGEHYRDNLQRFYRQRNPNVDREQLERYIADGIERHRRQERPFEFAHRGRRLRVASLAVPGLLRVRMWKEVPALDARPPGPGDSSAAPPALLDMGIAHLERVVDGVLVVDAAGAISWANRSFLVMYGIADFRAIDGKTFADVLAAAWQQADDDGMRRARSLAGAQDAYIGASFEVPLPPDRWIRVVEQAGVSSSGFRYFLHLEITELRRQRDEVARAEQHAREQERLYLQLARYSTDVTVSIRRWRIVYASPAATRMLGWEAAEILGAPVARLVHPDDRAVLRRVAVATTQAGESECRLRAVRKDGGSLWVEARARRFDEGDAAEQAGAVVNVRDVTARKQMEEELEAASAQLQRLADADALTGLPNRRKFDRVLERECRRARRNDAPLAMILIDIDHFKAVNDSYGHVVGDRVLKRVAEVIARAARRAGELPARYGGEEFGVILPNASLKDSVERAELLRQAIESLDVPPGAPRVTVSCGVASANECAAGLTPLDLVELADRALYQAKRAGRNRVEVLSDGAAPPRAGHVALR